MEITIEEYRKMCKQTGKPVYKSSKYPKDIVIHIDPIPKPRMTIGDKWKSRPATDRYWAYKKELVLICNKNSVYDLPVKIESVRFYISMPNSWTKKKKDEMRGEYHTAKPDLDNLLKGLQDALCREDSHIASISNGLEKFWSDHGRIEIVF